MFYIIMERHPRVQVRYIVSKYQTVVSPCRIIAQASTVFKPMGGLWDYLHVLIPVCRFLFPIPYTYSSSDFRPMTLTTTHKGHGQTLQKRTRFPPGGQEGLWPASIKGHRSKIWVLSYATYIHDQMNSRRSLLIPMNNFVFGANFSMTLMGRGQSHESKILVLVCDT